MDATTGNKYETDNSESESDDSETEFRSKYDLVYNLKTKKAVHEIKRNPTDVNIKDHHWIIATNFKYEDKYETEKLGKWMLFPGRPQVNGVWTKVKEAIKTGELWEAKVQGTVEQEGDEQVYPIMIYTKDYTDLRDVIKTLDVIEKLNIKPPNVVIKYKTDNQTRTGIYTGGHTRPWIYSSKDIRSIRRSDVADWRNPSYCSVEQQGLNAGPSGISGQLRIEKLLQQEELRKQSNKSEQEEAKDLSDKQT